MAFIPKPPLFIGIEPVSSTSFKIAAIKKRGKGWVFPFLQEISKEELAELLKTFPSTCTGISSRDILVKTLFIPVKGKKKIEAAFPFQIEPLLPYPLDKCVVDYVKGEERESGTSLTAFSVKKESLSRHLEWVKNHLSLEPDTISAPMLALGALSQEMDLPNEPFFFVHIGKEEGVCVIVENRVVIAARAFEKEKKEIEKTFLSLEANHKNKKIDALYLISEEKGWEEKIYEATNKKVLSPTLPSLPLSSEAIQKYGLPIGYALSIVQKSPHFRKKEFCAPFSWKKWRLPIFLHLSLLVSLFFSFMVFEKKALKTRREAIFHEFATRFPSLSKQNTLTLLEESLKEIEKKRALNSDLFPLLPITPKVTDFLAWLSSQPTCPKIEDFQYTLVKYPHINTPEERYQIKCDLKLSGSADSIKTLFANPNSFIDPKKEIEWKVDKGVSSVTLYLKDRTQYFR